MKLRGLSHILFYTLTTLWVQVIHIDLSKAFKVNIFRSITKFLSGFSFTENDSGYARNQTDIARDLYSAIIQFFLLFPEYNSNDFYLTGESYAGKQDESQDF